MRYTITLLICLLSTSLFADTLTVVDKSVCQQRGSLLWRCNPGGLNLPLTTSVPDYMPLEVLTNIRLEGNCSTSYPIYLDLRADDLHEVRSIQLFQERNTALSHIHLKGYNSMAVRVDSPYQRVAKYHSSCRILADVDANAVNVPQLTQNMRNLKADSRQDMRLVEGAIEDKELIIDMVAAISIYEQVLVLADRERVDFGSLNGVLVGGCGELDIPEEDCVWEEYMWILTDGLDLGDDALSRSQKRRLREFAIDLDAIVPGDCGQDNCIEPLISPQVRQLLNDIIARAPNTSDVENELTELQQLKVDLELLIDEYKQACAANGIDWGAL